MAELTVAPRPPGPRATPLLNSLTSEQHSKKYPASWPPGAFTSGKWSRPSLFIHKEWSIFSWEHHTQTETQNIKEKGQEGQEETAFSSALGQHGYHCLRTSGLTKSQTLTFPWRIWVLMWGYFLKKYQRYHYISSTPWYHSYFQKEK